MPLIKSISGTRGTIGGTAGTNLTPIDIVEFAAAYGANLLKTGKTLKVVVGRDARISGELVQNLVANTLMSMGIDIVDLGLTTTPTVAMAVPNENAGGGIIITASHNPKHWNALKFLNHKGEFVSAKVGKQILKIAEKKLMEFATIDKLGTIAKKNDYIEWHINKILELPLVKTTTVRKRNFKVVVDCVNSTGALAIPPLLEKLGCEVFLVNEEVNGRFAHNPEPLPENLNDLSRMVHFHNAHLGIAVDPDVDRLAFVCEDGEMFGEEYTLVAIADYVLQNKPGNTVSNLSSTRSLKLITEKQGHTYTAAAVGEVNVVTTMKKTKAVIGGEGNGGVIYPELHYGRDALVGIALFLSYLAEFGKPVSFLRNGYPSDVISKNKIQLTPDIDLDKVLEQLSEKYGQQPQNTVDGLKIQFDEDWIHLRKSNTEPIIRIYAESHSEVMAQNLANKIQTDISELMKKS